MYIIDVDRSRPWTVFWCRLPVRARSRARAIASAIAAGARRVARQGAPSWRRRPPPLPACGLPVAPPPPLRGLAPPARPGLRRVARAVPVRLAALLVCHRGTTAAAPLGGGGRGGRCTRAAPLEVAVRYSGQPTFWGAGSVQRCICVYRCISIYLMVTATMYFMLPCWLKSCWLGRARRHHARTFI